MILWATTSALLTIRRIRAAELQVRRQRGGAAVWERLDWRGPSRKEMAQQVSRLPATPLDFLGLIVSGLVLFGVFVSLAVAYRRNSKAHKRLMYLATINLLQAAIVRIPLPFLYFAGPWTTFPIAYAFVLPLFLWDLRSIGRIHPTTLFGGAGLFASLPVRMWLSETPLWLALARSGVEWVSN